MLKVRVPFLALRSHAYWSPCLTDQQHACLIMHFFVSCILWTSNGYLLHAMSMKNCGHMLIQLYLVPDVLYPLARRV